MTRKPLFKPWHKCSSILMMLALLWLALSTPFIYSAEQESKKIQQFANWQADDTNPFSNTTEEKSETSNSVSEYLHDSEALSHQFVTLDKYFKCHPSDLYFEFHPELISPPPEV